MTKYEKKCWAELDRRLAAFKPAQQVSILRRLFAVAPLVGYGFIGDGFLSKTAYIREAAEQAAVSTRTIWRWYRRYMKRRELADLMDASA